MNPKFPDIAWIASIAALLAYEGYALYTGHETLSRAIWTADTSPYGKLLPVIAGILTAHFFTIDIPSILAFLFGFVGGGLFWHEVH